MRTLLLAALFAIPASAQIKNPDTFVYATIGDPDSLDLGGFGSDTSAAISIRLPSRRK